MYGRRQLAPAWGHLAGWGFVVGKTASCTAMALTVGAYLWPSQERLVAVVAVGSLRGRWRLASAGLLLLPITLLPVRICSSSNSVPTNATPAELAILAHQQWGLAAVICLVHDVIIVVGLVAISNTVIGRALGSAGFKIDLPMIAAILTVIGYSVNDTIVVFDRIRENRGRLSDVTPKMVNTSISQTLSRTLLTLLTSLISVSIMYIFGGQNLRGFTFAIGLGIIIGTYSSIAIAAPLLLLGTKIPKQQNS